MSKGLIYTALSAILYGSIGYFGAMLLSQGLSVAQLLFWRFFISTLMLLPFVLLKFRDANKTELKALAALFLNGAIFYGISTALYFAASKSIGTGLAMVIFFGYPLFVTALSVFVNGAPVGKITAISLLFITTGCCMIAMGQSFKSDFQGILFAMGAGLGYGLYIFCSKPASKAVSPISGTFMVCLGGTLTFLLYTFQEGSHPLWTHNSFVWTHIILFGLFGTVLPVLLMLLGLRTLSVSKASIISVLEPVTTLGIGLWLLEELATPIQLIGALVILIGAVIIQLDKDEEQISLQQETHN